MRVLFLLILLLAGPVFASPALHGTWSAEVDGQPMTVSFAAGGSGTVDGQPMRWQALGAMLFIEQGGEVGSYQFQVKGDALSVSGGDFGTVVTFARGTAAAARATKSPAAAGAAAGGNGGELVGKWCKGGSFSANAGGGSSSMTCFELKADGSYSYEHEGSMSAQAPGMWGGTTAQAADAGRWRLEGNRLTAQSRNGTVNRYQLEKRNHPKNRDPMLCLDGDCYTTYWQKAPW